MGIESENDLMNSKFKNYREIDKKVILVMM
jgi:hypothetical protein